MSIEKTLTRLGRFTLAAGIFTLAFALAMPAQAKQPARVGPGAEQVDREPTVVRPRGPIADQYIVTFRDGITNPRGLTNGMARRNGIELRGVYSTVLKGFAGRMPAAVAERLALHPDVAMVEQDLYVHADDLATGIDRMDVEFSLTADIDGAGGDMDIDIGVIDTGVAPHPDLNVAGFFNCIGGCVPAAAFDDHGHGTHVAGSAAARDDGPNFLGYEVVGVAPGARIWGVKALDATGSGEFADIISGIDLLTARGDIEVINMSLSGQGYLQALRTAIQNSVAAGVVNVVAAGNVSSNIYGRDEVLATGVSNTCLRNGRNCPDDIVPASYPEAMTVSAMLDFDGAAGGHFPYTSITSCIHFSDDDVMACFSNYSTSVDASNPVVSPGAAIDVAAPGVDILSTIPGNSYTVSSGTSMAAPHVAGAVALCILEDCAGLLGPPANAADVAAIRQAIIDGAEPQSVWGPADTLDPDGNREGMAYVGGPPIPILDVAITGMTAPDLSAVNTVQDVTVQVTNVGTLDAGTTSVSLSSNAASLISPAQDVILAAGQTATLTFSWQPTVVGTHFLTAQHGLADDDPDNNAALVLSSVSEETTDVWITGVIAPSPVQAGTLQQVIVGVVNNSTQTETFGILMTDNLGAITEPVHTQTLGPGAGVTLGFEWTPTEPGDHVITATATLVGDTDASNDSASGSSTVTMGPVITVDAVCYTGSGGRNANKHLISTVTITDNSGPVSGATVTTRIEDFSGGVRTATAVTDAAGNVPFTWKNATVGDIYLTEVESVNGDTSIDTPLNWVQWDADKGACF